MELSLTCSVSHTYSLSLYFSLKAETAAGKAGADYSGSDGADGDSGVDGVHGGESLLFHHHVFTQRRRPCRRGKHTSPEV